MRFLLDPNFQGEEEAANLSNIHEQVILEAGTKKELDDVKNSLLKATKKVDLKRSARVNRNSEPETRKSGRQEPVLRPVNCQKALKRSDSLTKKEKTELNLKTKEVEKENKVLKLKEHFEQGGALHARTYNAGNLSKFDLSKVRKKLSVEGR